MARDERVSFKLSPEKKVELERIAEEYGVTMSALCAFIVGQWLYQQTKVISPMVQGLAAVLKQQLESAVNDDSMLDIITKGRNANRA